MSWWRADRRRPCRPCGGAGNRECGATRKTREGKPGAAQTARRPRGNAAQVCFERWRPDEFSEGPHIVKLERVCYCILFLRHEHSGGSFAEWLSLEPPQQFIHAEQSETHAGECAGGTDRR